MTITIDSISESIIICQRWKYIWDCGAMSPWTYIEKKHFHTKIDSLIWSILGNKLFIKVRGNSDFAKRNQFKRFKVLFDIKWVLTDPNWVVYVRKIPKSKFSTSSVDWKKRIIRLDSNDHQQVLKKTVNGTQYYQIGVLHEFGHAIGNTNKIKNMHGDEYKNSPFSDDYRSLMHSANLLRKRHIDYIVSVLQKWLPNTIFDVSY